MILVVHHARIIHQIVLHVTLVIITIYKEKCGLGELHVYNAMMFRPIQMDLHVSLVPPGVLHAIVLRQTAQLVTLITIIIFLVKHACFPLVP